MSEGFERRRGGGAVATFTGTDAPALTEMFLSTTEGGWFATIVTVIVAVVDTRLFGLVPLSVTCQVKESLPSAFPV